MNATKSIEFRVWKINENQLTLDFLLLKVFGLVLLQEELDLGAAANGRALVVANGERAAGRGLPDVLVVVVVLGGDADLVGDQVGRVETAPKLTDHRNIGTGGEGLHESLCTGLGNGTQVVDQISFGHTDTRIEESESTAVGIRNELNFQLLL